jgi:V/A-type H+/Na+-transporting ATPase subunit K
MQTEAEVDLWLFLLIYKEVFMNYEKVLIAFSAALAIGLPALATAWAQSKIGAAGAGALAEKPELTGTIVILVAIPETMVILGFVVSTMILFTVK